MIETHRLWFQSPSYFLMGSFVKLLCSYKQWLFWTCLIKYFLFIFSKGQHLSFCNALCLAVFVYKPSLVCEPLKSVRKNRQVFEVSQRFLQSSLSVFISDNKHAHTSNESHKSLSFFILLLLKLAGSIFSGFVNIQLVQSLNLITSLLFLFIPVRLVWSFVTKEFLRALE